MYIADLDLYDERYFLASRGVEVSIVSELMGHSHKSMTLNRYTKGYPIDALYAEINKLDAV